MSHAQVHKTLGFATAIANNSSLAVFYSPSRRAHCGGRSTSGISTTAVWRAAVTLVGSSNAMGMGMSSGGAGGGGVVRNASACTLCRRSQLRTPPPARRARQLYAVPRPWP